MKVLVKKPNQPAQLVEWDMPSASIKCWAQLRTNLLQTIGCRAYDKMRLTDKLMMYVDDAFLLDENKQFNFVIEDNVKVYNTVVVLHYDDMGFIQEKITDITENEYLFCSALMNHFES